MHRIYFSLLFVVVFTITTAYSQSQDRMLVGIESFSGHGYAEKVRSIVLDVFTKNKRFEVIDVKAREKVDREKEAQKDIGFTSGNIVDQNKNLGAEILVFGVINSMGAEYERYDNGSGGYYSGHFNITIKAVDVVHNTLVASEVITESGRSNPKENGTVLEGLISSVVNRGSTGDTEQEALDKTLSRQLPKYINEFIRSYFPVEVSVYDIIKRRNKYYAHIVGGEELGILDKTKMEIFYRIPKEINGETKYLEKVVGEMKQEETMGDFVEFKITKGDEDNILALWQNEDVKLLVREKP